MKQVPMALPMPRLPECNITHTRSDSSIHSSDEVIPAAERSHLLNPLVRTVEFLSYLRMTAENALKVALQRRHRSAISRPSRRCSRPTGTSREIWSKMRFKDLSSSCAAVSEVRAAIMPQPMSTPTAVGIMAGFVAMN
ncbi:MAG: hypothetical protein ACXWCS_14610, partial [Burkholderiales bacterium]